MASFSSILFPDRSVTGSSPPVPDCFPDLHLDQVVAAVSTAHLGDGLEEFFYIPVHDLAGIEYRQAVFRDLENDHTRGSVLRFVDGMRTMGRQLEQSAKLWHPLQRQGWFLGAVASYCAALTALHDEFMHLEPNSAGLRGFSHYLAHYLDSDAFHALRVNTEAVRAQLREVRYTVHIQNLRVHVERFTDQTDYSLEVVDTFERFATEARDDCHVAVKNHPDMNHVEEQVLECVAKLYPETFSTLHSYCRRHEDFVESTIDRFVTEVRFYLAYVAFMRDIATSEPMFSYPDVRCEAGVLDVEGAFDLALAVKARSDDKSLVCNDFRLSGPERIFVVTGPNQGGKTTFARAIGQCAYLASLGCPVPAKRATMALHDQIYTHFERRETVATLHGKLDDELVRILDILTEATSASLVIMNESFSSTTLNDALLIGTEVLQRISALGCVAVYVSFLDELADLSPACVSMVGEVAPDDPTQRTFTFTRRPADGLAYAAALADKYGLNYDALRRRVSR